MNQEIEERWRSATETAPSADDVREALANMEEARRAFEEAQDHLHRTVVAHSLVYGFKSGADLAGVTTKQAHAWRRAVDPDGIDVFTPYEREQKKEAREFAKKAAEARDLQRRAEEAERYLSDLRERMGYSETVTEEN